MVRGRPSRATLYARLDAALAELRERLGGLPTPTESEGIWSDIWHLEAHHSTALEGNTLVLREVEALLESGRAVGAKPLREYMEVTGYADAARWVYAQALSPGDWQARQLVSLHEVRRVHFQAMTPVWGVAPHEQATENESPGKFREHDIRAFLGGMKPPSWTIVAARMADWIDEANHAAASLAAPHQHETPMPEVLARLHNEFECIHPFLDGNGRAGRLLLNLMLVRLGYPPVIVLKGQRSRYLVAMQKADIGEYGPLGELLARAMYDNLNRFIVPNLSGPAKIVPLASLVDRSFSIAALRQAAQRGRLDAVQGSDGIWRSSRKAVNAYKRNKGKRVKRGDALRLH